MGVFVGKPHPPRVALLTPRYVLRAWSRIFQSMVLPSIYTLRSYIPFVRITSWSRHACLCVSVCVYVRRSVNHASYRRTAYETQVIVVRNPETHHSLDPRVVTPGSKNWFCNFFKRLSAISLMHFHRTLCSDVSFVLLWYHSWNSQTDASNNLGKI